MAITTTSQPLAIAPPITVSYTCNGQKSTTTFSGYPSSGARDAAAKTWLANMAEKCTFGNTYDWRR